uniref:DUF1618 domain-containing protein n=1 Tax=Hordeum vulgare subsp. vulgare TaxID=112509 RepID=A0A8I6YDD3_HORVV
MEETAFFPDWAMLDRSGRTRCHKDLDAARLVVSKNKSAARIRIDPPQPLLLRDLVLFDIYDSSRIPYPGAPPDLLVYTAAGPSPSVQQLPLFPKGGRASWRFMRGKFTTGILRLSKKRYVVADLSELDAAICVFNSSQTKQWKIISITPGLVCWSQSQSSGQLPDPWSTDDVLAFDGRFLCWVDYFRGVLLSDFSSTSVVLHYVPFPGEKEYPEDVAKRFPGRFRNVSITQGKMCFVHIDNDFHETFEDDCPCPCRQLPERIISQPQQHLGPQKNHHLDSQLQQLQVQVGATWEDEFYGKGWMIMVDMKQANLRSCTRYVNRQFYCANCVDKGCTMCEEDKDEFLNVLLLPNVFSKQFEKPTGMALDNDKVATRLSRKRKLKSGRFV